jgi:hypothetical protein
MALTYNAGQDGCKELNYNQLRDNNYRFILGIGIQSPTKYEEMKQHWIASLKEVNDNNSAPLPLPENCPQLVEIIKRFA